jgi:hypothetical protein
MASRANADGGPAILVVRPSSLGDVVHALALVADVHAKRPELAVDWVAEEAFAALPALHPGVRRVIPVALRRWRRRPLAAATCRSRSRARSSRAWRGDRAMAPIARASASRSPRLPTSTTMRSTRTST